MNPTTSIEAWCEWPIRSRFAHAPERSCGREGHGAHVRLCWQHRDAINAEVVDALYERPDLMLSELLADWVRSTETTKYDSPERAKEREKSQRVAAGVLSQLAGYYGDIDSMPPFIQRALEPLIERAIEKRLEQTWGTA